jgi:Flp pilus assembly protein CpaB
VSRRARAVAFAGAAALCAGLAASATGGPGGDPAAQFGALREVVVATQPLPGDRPLREKVIRRALELRRVPERFVSPDALSSPAQALGRSPAVPVPAGGYLLDSHLQSAEAERRHSRRLPGGRRRAHLRRRRSGRLDRAAPGRPIGA